MTGFLNRRQFLKAGLLFSSGVSVGSAAISRALGFQAVFKFEPERPLIQAPADPSLWPEFRQQLASWRELKRHDLNYSDALYRREEFQWARSSFACCLLMLCDETFYDSKAGEYKVKEFVRKGRREFGGFDSVVLWHAYPRIGFDDRNQFDFYRDAPGGIEGLSAVVRQLHREGLKVYIDYNPWDTGTRREGKEDLDALAVMVASLQIDGIFLDTMDHGSEAFRAKLDATRKGVALEGEDALPLERVRDHHLSWAQWFSDSQTPGVLRNKWFERRHMQHQIQRWNRDHTAELQTAWMNGSGMLVWENVFGSLNRWSARDRSLLRAMLPIQRRFSALFAGEKWEPLVPTLMPDVYASLWCEGEIRLWTLVNLSSETRNGVLLRIEALEPERVFDLIAGKEVLRSVEASDPNLVRGVIPPRGIGCIIAGSGIALGKDFKEFLAQQSKLASRASWNASPPQVHTVLRSSRPAREPAQRTLVTGMAAIPRASLRLKTEFRVRECGFYDSLDRHFMQKFPSLHQPILIERDVALKPYAMDLTPVTNAQFAEFLKASGYRQRHAQKFLKHWPQAAPPPGKEDHPVVYVDLDDARAFARWAGKRLPTEEEWQYAAQGPDGREYPWGNEMLPERCNGGQTGSTTPVTAFPEGGSPFGLFDLCGNVWEWTESERSDGRTRFCIIRGGSFYHAPGSDWYADGGPKPCNFAAKFLLMWPGLDRCATVGFRCAAGLED